MALHAVGTGLGFPALTAPGRAPETLLQPSGLPEAAGITMTGQGYGV